MSTKLLAFTLVISACAEPVDETTGSLSTNRQGVDYAWARPSLPGLAGQGYTFAARYLSYDASKNLSIDERNALVANGFDIVLVWENAAGDALAGFDRGASHARTAQDQANAVGMPVDRPIYFAVDFDAAERDQPAIDAYFDGVASVIGRERTGAYAGLWPIRRLFDHGKIAYGWQTYAWSGGQWDARAQLRQVENGLAGDTYDRDEAIADDFGQWGQPIVEDGPPPVHPPLPTRCGAIEPGHGLSRGQSWPSCDGRFTLALHDDGTLVWSSFDVPMWSRFTGGRGEVVVMQGDGNLVLYSSHSHPLFASRTDGHFGASARLQDDGNFVVYDGPHPLWWSGPANMPPSPSRCGTLDPGRGLSPGQVLGSCDGTHRLAMQGDGNLVLYHGGAIWAANTRGTSTPHLLMQTDGNLVVYDRDGIARWNTGTQGHFGAHLEVQGDGNLVIYEGANVLWASWTNGR